jgi:hypothetical protein
MDKEKTLYEMVASASSSLSKLERQFDGLMTEDGLTKFFNELIMYKQTGVSGVYRSCAAEDMLNIIKNSYEKAFKEYYKK